jgi:hypothetical protein
MLFSTAELSKPKRIQGAYLSDSEINDVVNYIKEKSGAAEYLEGITERQKVGGVAGVGMDGNHGDEDELFEEAKEIIVKAGKASTSMLQRRLSIGYGRAAKILDMLEEGGIIGPSNGSKPREVMISREQYEAEGGMSAMPIHNRAESKAPDNYFDSSDEDEGDDGVLDFGKDEPIEHEEEIEAETQKEEIEEELELTPSEEDEVIEDEDEILEEIRENKTSEIKKPSFPPSDDDEMFFSK